MKTHLFLAAAALLASVVGCSNLADPCASEKGTCLGIHIDPSASVRQIDSATLHVTGGGIDRTVSATSKKTPPTMKLPVAVAIVFDNTPDGAQVAVDITGVLGGNDVGHATASAT